MEEFILINKIERLDHLQSLVRQDIKDLGIKLPKLRRLKKLNQTRSTSQDDVFSSRIFGEPLYQVHGTIISDYGYVPEFLIDAAKAVDKHIETEGIFRKSGSISRQKELQLTIDEGKSIEAANIYDITVLIKQFFRELPEPIFATVYHESFIKCYNLSPDKDPKKALLQMCLLLPMENIGVLRFTLHLLSRVASKCDKNKMSPNNLAVVMAPNLLHLNKGTEKMSSGEEKLLHVHTCIIELLIKNWDLVGMVSPALRQQLSMMSEYFATDDDLAASDDNTLEDSKDVLRRKKRKRSGSLTGFVSSIAHGIAKLRRSTDGKSLTSNSYISKDELFIDTNDITEQTLAIPDSVTPCVMRKKQTCVEGVPFSATKRQAILSNLQQKSALASTPFTPASTVKRGNHPYYSSAAKTASLNATTPALGSKTSRKKLNLFNTPGSGKKVKRQNSASARLESPPTLDKSGKGKNFFRRLSGGRAVKNTSRDTSTFSATSEQIEEGLADSLHPAFESTHLDSTATHDLKCSVTLRSLSSTSLLQDSEMSIVVVDDQMPLSSGFEDAAGALAHAVKRQKYAAGSVHESRGPGGEVVTAHGTTSPCRSKSLHSPNVRKDPAAENNHMPGDPPSSKMQCKIASHMSHTPLVGVPTDDLKGNTEVRRSRKDEFENGNVGSNARKAKGHYQSQDTGVSLRNSDPKSCSQQLEEQHNPHRKVPAQLNTSLLDTVLSPPCGFGDHTVFEDQLSFKQITDQDEDDEEIDVGCDIESVSGFSTISGGTVMRRTESGKYLRHGLQSTSGSSLVSCMSYDSVLKPSMKCQPLQSASSNDSLFSVGSRLSDKSTGSEPKLNRCTSSDSGKGSLLEDATEDLCPDRKGKYNNAFLVNNSNAKTFVEPGSDCIAIRHGNNFSSEDSCNANSAHKRMKVSATHKSLSMLPSSTCAWESSRDSSQSEEKRHSLSLDTTQELEDMPDKTDINRRRSISAEHLGVSAASRASMRMRSHSIHISPGKKFNYKPHLEITRETHKLLARAGYFKPADDNFTSRYVQVEVKSPKRSSHREEMILSLRSSFRERHSQMNGSVRSVSHKCNSPDNRTATQDRSTFGNIDEFEKLSAHKPNDQDSVTQSECLDMGHRITENTANVEAHKGDKLSFPQVNEYKKFFTGVDVMEYHHNFSQNESAAVQLDNDERKPARTDKDERKPARADKDERKPAQNSKAVEAVQDTDKIPSLSGVLHKEIVSQVKIKRADVVLQKHDSIVNIQQAGLVTQSVRHFTESQASGQFCNFAMPPVSKRGTSPVRIPTIFAKSDHRSNHYKHMAGVMREKTGSRDLMKISALSNAQSMTQQDLALKACDDLILTDSENLQNEMKDADTKSTPNDGAQIECPAAALLETANLELSESLVETITDVCTPRSVKFQNKKQDKGLTKSPLLESTNTAQSSSQSSSRGNIERIKLPTSGDLTPCQKDTGVSSRRNTPMKANWHNIKRLNNHNSPRKGNVRSPKRKTSSQRGDMSAPSDTLQLLTSVDIQIDDKKT